MPLKTDNKKDKSERPKHDKAKKKDLKEDDVFEKTANELEEVLKRKFPDPPPLPKSSSQKSSLTNATTTSLSPILEKNQIKTEPGITDPPKKTKITNTSSTNTTAIQSHFSNTSSPTSIPHHIPILKKEETIKKEVQHENKSGAPPVTNLKKNQSILDIKMDTAKLHHQHILLNMIRSTPIKAKNFYKHERMIDSTYESSSGEEDDDGEEEYVEKIEFTEWFPPDRWKVNEKIIVTDVTINDKSTGNDRTVTMRESHQPEGFFGGSQKRF
jgi:hypothetical protein